MTMILETARPDTANTSGTPGATLRIVGGTGTALQPDAPATGTALSGYDEIYSDYLRWVGDDIMDGSLLP